MRDHVVRQGECMSSIAYLYGFSWKVLWDAAENRELKKSRQDPNVLFPGDVVKIPDKQTKYYACATDARHLFKLNGFKAVLRIRVMKDDQPRANENYLLEIDGTLMGGQTDAAGWLEKKIPPNAVRGKLTLSNGLENYDLQLGKLDPVHEVSGIEGRLMNLGYYGGPISGSMNPDLQAALRAFQAGKGLQQSGEADDATKAALQQEHTS
jgi:hypothetical protein